MNNQSSERTIIILLLLHRTAIITTKTTATPTERATNINMCASIKISSLMHNMHAKQLKSFIFNQLIWHLCSASFNNKMTHKI